MVELYEIARQERLAAHSDALCEWTIWERDGWAGRITTVFPRVELRVVANGDLVLRDAQMKEVYRSSRGKWLDYKRGNHLPVISRARVRAMDRGLM